MNTVYLQIWEESEKSVEVRPDGCSLHIDIISLNEYVKDIYSNRSSEDIPDTYERVLGSPITVRVDQNIFEIVEEKKSVRLFEYEMNNLISLGEILL